MDFSLIEQYGKIQRHYNTLSEMIKLLYPNSEINYAKIIKTQHKNENERKLLIAISNLYVKTSPQNHAKFISIYNNCINKNNNNNNNHNYNTLLPISKENLCDNIPYIKIISKNNINIKEFRITSSIFGSHKYLYIENIPDVKQNKPIFNPITHEIRDINPNPNDELCLSLSNTQKVKTNTAEEMYQLLKYTIENKSSIFKHGLRFGDCPNMSYQMPGLTYGIKSLKYSLFGFALNMVFICKNAISSNIEHSILSTHKRFVSFINHRKFVPYRKRIEQLMEQTILHKIFVKSCDEDLSRNFALCYCKNNNCHYSRNAIFRIKHSYQSSHNYCITCPKNCNETNICFYCGDDSHLNTTCKLNKLLKLNENSNLNHRNCPNCNVLIEKEEESCNSIKCTCGCLFCWRCLYVEPDKTKCHVDVHDDCEGLDFYGNVNDGNPFGANFNENNHIDVGFDENNQFDEIPEDGIQIVGGGGFI